MFDIPTIFRFRLRIAAAACFGLVLLLPAGSAMAQSAGCPPGTTCLQGDGRTIHDASMDAGSAALSSRQAQWSQQDVGKAVIVRRAGVPLKASDGVSYPGNFVGVIKSIAGITATLDHPAAVTVASSEAFIAPDLTVPMQGAVRGNSTRILLTGGIILRSVVMDHSDKDVQIQGRVEQGWGSSDNPTDRKSGKYPSLVPMFLVTGNVRNITFETAGEGQIVNHHHEAIQVQGLAPYSVSNLRISAHIIGSSVGVDYDSIYINHCDNCSVINSVIAQNSAMPPHFSYGEGQGIAVFNSRNVHIDGNSVSGNRANGIYIGSAVNYTIQNNKAFGNNMSGIQLNFNSPPVAGNPVATQHGVVQHNNVYNNSADGVDANNSVAPYDVDLTVAYNTFHHNGFFPPFGPGGKPTPDGSGVGTYVNLKNFKVLHNQADDFAGKGIALAGVSNFEVGYNTIAFSAGHEGVLFQGAADGSFHDNVVKSDPRNISIGFAGANRNLDIERNQVIGGALSIPNAGGPTSYNGIKMTGNQISTAATYNTAQFDLSGNKFSR